MANTVTRQNKKECKNRRAANIQLAFIYRKKILEQMNKSPDADSVLLSDIYGKNQ